MFFYLLKNSTIIETSLETTDKNIKILLYGSICYIVLHGCLFIGGSNALLVALKPYFWLFLILDLTIIYFTDKQILFPFNQESSDVTPQTNNITNGLSIFDNLLKKNNSNNNLLTNKVLRKGQQHPKLNQGHNKQNRKQKKRVSFQEPINDYYSSSESESEIGTDIDIESFKDTLYNL